MKVRLQSYELKLLLLLSVVAIFVTTDILPRPPPKVHGVYIHPDWSSNQTSESIFEQIARFGINTILVDVYGPTAVGKGVFLMEKKGAWMGKSEEPEFAGIFSLEETVERAQKFRISAYATISCFGGPGIDPRNELHQVHLREVVEYILTYFPTLSGVHLDYVRYMSEQGLNANGDAETITMFVRNIQQVVRGKALSAAVIAVGDQEEYDLARYQTGQDCRELSQYLDFICPMTYHLAFGRKMEWVGSVSRFMSGISQRPCQVFPAVQAYYVFERTVVVSLDLETNASIPGPTIEIPSTGLLQFDISWQNPQNRFSLKVKDPLSREVSADRSAKRLYRLAGETLVLNSNVSGMWTTELKVGSKRVSDDEITVRVSDTNGELPGYQVLRSAVSLAVVYADGFCVYALNNLSLDELQAIRDSLDSHACASFITNSDLSLLVRDERPESSHVLVKPMINEDSSALPFVITVDHPK